MKTLYKIDGMTCTACSSAIERTIKKINGVESAAINYATEQLIVNYDINILNSEFIESSIQRMGYFATPLTKSKEPANNSRIKKSQSLTVAENHTKNYRNRLVISLIFTLPLFYLAMGPMFGLPVPHIFLGEKHHLIMTLTQMFLSIPVMYIGRNFFTNGFKALSKRIPNMDSLIAVGTSASFIYGVYVLYNLAWYYSYENFEMIHHYSHEIYFEGVAVILTLVTLGKYFESRAKGKTSQAIEKLVALAPDTAKVLINGEEMEISIDDVKISDIVVIRPGDRIPVDGIIIEGKSSIDESLLTGESIPIEKFPGDSVICGSVNKNGAFKFKATKIGADTTLSKIIELVEEAQSTKAPIAKIADQISRIFVPIVMGIAVLTWIVWILLGKDFSFALSMGISILVVSCPCALGLATPTAIMVGTGKSANLGVLFKNANALETLGKTTTIVFDKTGTLTEGKPTLTNLINYSGLSNDVLLQKIASLEAMSEHPLSEAVIEAHTKNNLPLLKVDGFNAIPGMGIEGIIDADNFTIGNPKLMDKNSIAYSSVVSIYNDFSDDGKTSLLIGINGNLVAILAVSDTIKNSSADTVTQLKAMGINVVMLTGDNERAANAIAKKMYIDRVVSGVLPEEKAKVIKELQNNSTVVMVGDGINDAPSLAQSDIGIAIGSGTDIAIDSADIVLMQDNLLRIVDAIQLSKATVRNIKQNLFWAFFYNTICIPVAAGILFIPYGIKLNPMIAAGAMSLSSISVVLNALSLMRFIPHYKENPTLPIGQNSSKNAMNETPILKNEGEKVMVKLSVKDMSCMHCVNRVIKVLEDTDGITGVAVSLEKKEATFTATQCVDLKVICEKLTAEGYPSEVVK